MRTIIVGIDFLSESVAALKLAVLIAKDAKSKIVLVFVNTPEKSKPIFRTPPDKLNEEIDKRFKELIQDYTGKFPADQFVCKIIEGKKVCITLNKEAKAIKADLIILGTHGEKGIKIFKHSMAFQIVEKANVPVISVRDGAHVPASIKKVLIPIDDSLETRQKVPFAVQLAKNCGAEVHMLAVYHSSVKNVQKNIERYTRQSASYLEKNDINFIVKSIQTDEVVKETIKYARKIDADMIAIMTTQITQISNLWKGSFAEQLIDQSPIPVITVPAKELMRTLSR